MKQDYVSITYDEYRVPKTEYPSRLAKYLAERFEFKPGLRLLDVGCGRGDMLEAFANLLFDCYAVDSSISAVENSCKGVNVQMLDIENEHFPYPDNYFDVVFSKSVIEHIWNPSLLLSEIHRILQAGAICIIMTPDWVSQMKTFYEDPTHYRPYVPESIRDLLLMSNFRNVSAELFCQHHLIWNYPFFRFLASVLQLFLTTRKARYLTELTKIKFFRWAVEKMVLGWGYK